MNTQNGIIGFFDILGYQNLLTKNEPEDIAKTVITFLTNIGSEIPSEMKDMLEKYNEDNKSIISTANATIDAIKWLIFSDTILLTMPIQDAEEISPGFCWTGFLTACMNLQYKMFKNGLPLRGVINYGKYFISESCFAGRSIIEAYKLCNKLEISACVFTENARQELEKQDKVMKEANKRSLYGAYVHEYLIPKKDGESLMLTLASHTYDIADKDLRKQVLTSFWSYNKDIPLSAQQKVMNTEQWLIFLKSKRL